MYCLSVIWFICIYVPVAISTGYSEEEYVDYIQARIPPESEEKPYEVKRPQPVCPYLQPIAGASYLQPAPLPPVATTGAPVLHPRLCRKRPTDDDCVSYQRSLFRNDMNNRLIQTARDGLVEEMCMLLACGADFKVKGPGKRTALHWAAAEGQLEAARILLTAGAEVDARDRRRNTPLHEAAWRGDVAMVRLLVAFNANPNARGHWRRTPLHEAAYWGNAEAAMALLVAGADKRAEGFLHSRPERFARQNGFRELAHMLN